MGQREGNFAEEARLNLYYSRSSMGHLAGQTTTVVTVGFLDLEGHDSFKYRSDSGTETEDPLWDAKKV